jgi:hypothetical protein
MVFAHPGGDRSQWPSRDLPRDPLESIFAVVGIGSSGGRRMARMRLVARCLVVPFRAAALPACSDGLRRKFGSELAICWESHRASWRRVEWLCSGGSVRHGVAVLRELVRFSSKELARLLTVAPILIFGLFLLAMWVDRDLMENSIVDVEAILSSVLPRRGALGGGSAWGPTLWALAWLVFVSVELGLITLFFVAAVLDPEDDWCVISGALSRVRRFLDAPDRWLAWLRGPEQAPILVLLVEVVSVLTVVTVWFVSPSLNQVARAFPLVVVAVMMSSIASLVLARLPGAIEQLPGTADRRFLAAVSRLTTLGMVAMVLWEGLFTLTRPTPRIPVVQVLSLRNHSSAGSAGLVAALFAGAWIVRRGAIELMEHLEGEGKRVLANGSRRADTLAGFALILFGTTYHLSLDLLGSPPSEETRAEVRVPPQARSDHERWLNALTERIGRITDEYGAGELIVVSLSGGGSRAALFGRAVLDLLADVDLPRVDGKKPGTLADHVVLVTGISGGSLAAADFWAFPEHRSAEGGWTSMSEDVVGTPLWREACAPDEAGARWSRVLGTDCLPPETVSWVLDSRAVDRMSHHFASAWLRGSILPDLSRGEALALMWNELWAAEEARSGEAPWLPNKLWGRGYDGSEAPYAGQRPLLALGAVDAQTGERVLLGFPFIPASLPVSPTEEKRTGVRGDSLPPRTLDSYSGNLDLRLVDAVRASSAVPIAIDPFTWSAPGAKAGELPVLVDGGVYDNTGLDMAVSLLHASDVQEALSGRSVLLIEVDVGAEPTILDRPAVALGMLPPAPAARGRRSPLESIADGYGSMAPAAYRHDRLAADLLVAAATEVKDTTYQSVRNVRIDYRPDRTVNDQPIGPVTTAWALGPSDVSRVLEHFIQAIVNDPEGMRAIWDTPGADTAPQSSPTRDPEEQLVTASDTRLEDEATVEPIACYSSLELRALAEAVGQGRPCEQCPGSACGLVRRGGLQLLTPVLDAHSQRLQTDGDRRVQEARGLESAAKQEGFWVWQAAVERPVFVLHPGSNRSARAPAPSR